MKHLVLSFIPSEYEINVGYSIIPTWLLRKWGSEKCNKVTSVTQRVSGVKPKSVQGLALVSMLCCLPFSPSCQIPDQVNPSLTLICEDSSFGHLWCCGQTSWQWPSSSQTTAVTCSCNQTGGPVSNSRPLSALHHLNQALLYFYPWLVTSCYLHFIMICP